MTGWLPDCHADRHNLDVLMKTGLLFWRRRWDGRRKMEVYWDGDEKRFVYKFSEDCALWFWGA
jgi:hypothetical protein